MATLTYVYAEQTAVLGPLALTAEPGAYDLCTRHAERMSAPKGWEIIRLPDEDPVREFRQQQADDDLMALANAVRRIGLQAEPELPEPPAPPAQEGAPRLRLIAD